MAELDAERAVGAAHHDQVIAPASLRSVRTAALRGAGWTRHGIRAAMAEGRLVRLRPGVYGSSALPEECRAAAAVQGRAACVTALRLLGVFVLERGGIHVHIPRTASRLPARGAFARVHRRRLLRTPHPDALLVEPIDAVADAVRCQGPRAAIATIDSAVHRGCLRVDELDELFAALPHRYRRLRRLLDPRAESGAETLLRLIVRSLGCSFDCQVGIDGVGRVDVLVGGWLVIECDSRAFHSDGDAQRRDRTRDLEAARRGFTTLRVVAEDVFWRPDAVREAVSGVLRSRRAAREQARSAISP